MTEHTTYETPTMRVIGTVHDLTLNGKPGPAADVYSSCTPMVGSIAPP